MQIKKSVQKATAGDEESSAAQRPKPSTAVANVPQPDILGIGNKPEWSGSEIGGSRKLSEQLGPCTGTAPEHAAEAPPGALPAAATAQPPVLKAAARMRKATKSPRAQWNSYFAH